MNIKKTLVDDFIEYLQANKLGSSRLLHSLISGFSSYNLSDYFVEDISERDLMRIRNAGKKTIEEYKELKEKHLQFVKKKEILYENEDEYNTVLAGKDYRKKYECLLRFDVIRTLDTIYNEKYFVEKAILEKFERDAIQLIKSPSL